MLHRHHLQGSPQRSRGLVTLGGGGGGGGEPAGSSAPSSWGHGKPDTFALDHSHRGGNGAPFGRRGRRCGDWRCDSVYARHQPTVHAGLLAGLVALLFFGLERGGGAGAIGGIGGGSGFGPAVPPAFVPASQVSPRKLCQASDPNAFECPSITVRRSRHLQPAAALRRAVAAAPVSSPESWATVSRAWVTGGRAARAARNPLPPLPTLQPRPRPPPTPAADDNFTVGNETFGA